MRPRWDIFCKVIDNYGDAGVAWRLARQLAAEHGIAPRLWVDDLKTLARLAPPLDPTSDQQALAGVEVRRWIEPFPDVEPGGIVLETFGCDVPAPFAARMVQSTPLPVWINLEHLTAEAWVDDCHLLPSPHPLLPITRWFFYPGFSERTGGLLREAGLLAARDLFQADTKRQQALWAELGVPPRADAELRALLFCYDTPAAVALLDALAAGPRPVRVLVPEGVAPGALRALLGDAGAIRKAYEKQSLKLNIVPFLPQARWDRVLWACDFSVVRGEDSFLRAQWAGRPFVWAVYPQSDGAHRKKMSAFLERYLRDLEAPAGAALRELHAAWDSGPGVAQATGGFLGCLPVLSAHGRHWSSELAGKPDLARNIIEFASRV